MSDYKIYSIASYTHHNQPLRFESVGNDTFTIIDDSPSANFPVDPFDLVKVTVLQNGVKKYIYGVYDDQTYNGIEYRLICTFDSVVYADLAQANTSVEKLEYYALPSTHILDLSNYSLVPELNVATYGKYSNVYNTVERYTITAPQQKLNLNQNLRELYSFSEKVLVDSCTGKAYKVSPSEISAVAVGGKITTALNFNVIIK